VERLHRFVYIATMRWAYVLRHLYVRSLPEKATNLFFARGGQFYAEVCHHHFEYSSILLILLSLLVSVGTAIENPSFGMGIVLIRFNLKVTSRR
jgi:hypothetical protein